MKLLLSLFILTVFSLVNANSFLMPEEAFKPYAKVDKNMNIVTGVTIAEDIYLYENALKIQVKNPAAIEIANINSPKSTKHHDEDVYLDSPEFLVALKSQKSEGIEKVTLVINYQGCSEQGLCYEPSSKEFTLDIDLAKLGTVDKEDTPEVEKSQTDSIADTIKSGSIGIILLTFFGFGLLLAMTPCVFPMIPIISGLIISQGNGLSTRKAFALSVVYVISMAIAYTIAGVLAGLFGENLQAALQTPWVIYGFSFIFVALAFSMFGFYELKLPDAIVSRVSSSKNRSGFIGVAIMGFLSALIVGPCVAAPLAGALVYIGQTGDAVLGGLALFSMSIGMGLPLIVVGVSAGKFMPKPGAWMTMVSATFGVMMLAVAIWMLEKIVDPSTIVLLYSFLGIGFSLYLGAFEKESHIFKKSTAVIMFIYSVSLFIGYLGGSSSMTKPLGFLQSNGVAVSSAAKSAKHNFEVVHSIQELDALLEKNKGKKIMLDFSAEWCTSCKELEEITFADAKVSQKMDEFVLINADVTSNSAEEKALSKKYGVFGPPAIMFFDEKSNLRKEKTVIGYIKPDEFLEHLNKL